MTSGTAISEFTAAGYDIVGVSPDKPPRNAKFREKEGLNFDLLSDEDHALADDSGRLGREEDVRQDHARA